MHPAAVVRAVTATTCTLADVLFYTACNLGQVYGYISESTVATDPCNAYINSAPESVPVCECCKLSAPISKYVMQPSCSLAPQTP